MREEGGHFAEPAGMAGVGVGNLRQDGVGQVARI